MFCSLKYWLLFLVGIAAAEESCSSDTVVFSPGDNIADFARFPITLTGDWEKVLASPKITKIPVADTVFWTEGPIVRDGVFYASDTVRAQIYRISEIDGKYNFEIWATQGGGIDPTLPEYDNVAEPGSNGMATDLLDPNFVVINQHGMRRVIRCRLDDHTPGAPLSECPDLEVITDSYNGLPYNSPNDMVLDPADGTIFFTDPTYGMLEKSRFCDQFSCETGQFYLDAVTESGILGVYKVDRKTKNVELVTDLHHRPNGIGLFGDTLWVADSTNFMPSWTSYDVGGETLTSKASSVINRQSLGVNIGRMGQPLTGGEGLADGFKIDEQGLIWTSIPNGFAVIDPSSQEVVCQILLGINTSNLAFGNNGDVWLTGFNSVWKISRKIVA